MAQWITGRYDLQPSSYTHVKERKAINSCVLIAPFWHSNANLYSVRVVDVFHKGASISSSPVVELREMNHERTVFTSDHMAHRLDGKANIICV
jgi:hypothetical protein